jgi:hypothetical protein
MPWKDGYTTSDERSLTDREVLWPDGHQCACVLVVDLSVASGPEGITPADLPTAESHFGIQVGIPSLLDVLQRFNMTATFAVPQAPGQARPDGLACRAPVPQWVSRARQRSKVPWLLLVPRELANACHPRRQQPTVVWQPQRES